MSDFLDSLLNRSQPKASLIMPRPVSTYESTPELTGVSMDEISLDAGAPSGDEITNRYSPRPDQPERSSSTDLPDQATYRLAVLQGRLDRLAARFGFLSEEMAPHLTPAPTQPPVKIHSQAQGSTAISKPPREKITSTLPHDLSESMAFQVNNLTANRHFAEQTRESEKPLPSSPPDELSPVTIREHLVSLRPAAQNPPIAAPPSTKEQPALPIQPAQPTADLSPGKKPGMPSQDLHPNVRNVSRLLPRPVTSPIPIERRRRGQPVKSAPTQPVVNVSIGRIEVRAPRKDAPVSAPSPMLHTSSVISLDEYLRQRRGGGRE